MPHGQRKLTEFAPDWMPLHAAQEAVYYDQMRDPAGAKYNVGGYIRVRGEFDAEIFRVALSVFSRAHPQERIEIDAVAGVLAQRSAPIESLPAIVMRQFQCLADALAWMQDRMDRPFDLARPPLHEHALLRIGAGEVLYFARYHHVVADAYSFALKIRTVLDLYLRLAAGEAIPEQAGDSGYRGEIDACLGYLESAEHTADAAYWSDKYQQVPAPVWPGADDAERPLPSAEAAVELPAESTCRLLDLARDARVGPAHVLLAIVSIYVARTTGARDVVVGVAVHNRVYRRQKSLFGMLSTIMPSRVTLDCAVTFRELVQAISAAQNEDLLHRRYPWTHLARQLRIRDGRRPSLFDVAVNFEPFMPWTAAPGLLITAHELASRQEDIPLHVKLCDFGGHQPQILKLACTAGMLGGRAVDAVATELLAVIAATLADPDRSVLALLGNGEQSGDRGECSRHSMVGVPPLELPLDRPRPLQPATTMRGLQVLVQTETAARMTSAAHRHAVSPLAVLFAAWSLLQARLSGQDDIATGLCVENAVLPLRLRIDPDTSVATLLRAAEGVLAAALEHRSDRLPEAGAANAADLRAVLSWQAAALPAPAAGVDLQLAARHDETGLYLWLAYAEDRVDAATAQRWAGHMLVLLGALVADAAPRVGVLPILAPVERHALLEGFNDTRVDYPDAASIHALFEAQAERAPDSIALEHEQTSLTYAQLNTRANRLAHALQAHGVRADRLVAICVERGIDLVVAMLAVLKAGGAYVPLDPGYPAERLRSMLDDAEPVLILSQQSCREHLPATTAPVWLLDDEAMFAAQPTHNPYVAHAGSRHLAYVIFTSGSTGRPKGVMVEHRSVVRLVVNNTFAPIGPGDCVAQCASPAFDATTWEVWATLLNGARLLLVPLPVLLRPDELNRCFLQRGVTALFITVALFNEYIEPLAEAFSRLKYLLVGGDVLDPRKVGAVVNSSTAPRWFKACYGPTEATTFASMHEVTQVGADTRSIPLGTPIANTTIYLLDAQRQPVPIGVRGELYIGGPGVARGYLKRPELTAERFVADPFASEPGARLYRTGDLGRYRADGAIEFSGRNDFQVKIRGFRVEPSEVEVQLFSHAPVVTCAVLALENPGGSKYLAAWVVPGEGRAADCQPAALRALLLLSMPDYLVPSVFVVVDALPMTPNGKIDRDTLRARGARPVSAAASYVAPATATQRVIAAMWADLLGIARIGLHDDVWMLGWHSLLATQALTRLRDAFQIELPFRALLETSTVAQTAEAVAVFCGGRDVADAIGEMVETVMGMSDAQAHALLQHALTASEPAGRVPATVGQ